MDGIFSKGYGIVPKLVMLEGSLSIDAKALYAYFCAYSGDSMSCYPPREKILRDLGFCTATYYTYLGELRDGGYISVKKHKSKRQEWCNNRIVLLQNPLIIAKAQSERRFSMTDTLKDYGYGRIPLVVMTDRRISRKAKALYAYFCSFAGGKEVCTPEIDFTLSFLGVCVNSYYKYLNELLCLNYITVFHRKDERGRFISNSIALNRQPCRTDGLKLAEERRARYEQRCSAAASKATPPRRRKHRRFIQTPQQLTGAIRRQIDYGELVKSLPEKQLNMIAGFISELHFDPCPVVDAASIGRADIEGFLSHMQRSISPDAKIRHVVSYWQRSFINYLLDNKLLQEQTDAANG